MSWRDGIRAALLAAATAAAAAGCGSHPHRGMGTEIDWAATPLPRGRAELPADFRKVTIGDVKVAAQYKGGEDEEVLAVEEKVLRHALKDLLAASGAFDDVKLAEERTGTGADAAPGLRLDARIKQASLRRLPDEESGAGNFFAYFFGGWIADWRHDRTFEMRLDPVLSLTRAEKPFVESGPVTATARDDLSLFERRGGAGPVAASVFWIPQFAFASDGGKVNASLAHACLREPVRQLLNDLEDVKIEYRLVVESAAGRTGVKAEVLSPEPNTLVTSSKVDLQVRVTVRPEAGRLKGLVVGGKEIAASGTSLNMFLPGMDVGPGKKLTLAVALDKGDPVPVAVLSVREHVTRVSLGKAPSRSRP